MVLANEYPIIAGLYCRISREDDSVREISSSIETQKQKLIDFAEKSDMHIHSIYCDDGYSGTNFNRPAFINLLKDVENGDVNCVIVKDLSRLGREYIQSGQILETFLPEHKARFIAIDDNIDLDPMSDTSNASMLIPFYNMINEFYPADISKKTRSALQTKAKSGQYLAAKAPYGYIKSPDNKNKLVIDNEASKHVKFIYDKYCEGWSLTRIAKHLHSAKVPTALNNKNKNPSYNWMCSTVRAILTNETYTGKIVYGKTRNLSYKNKTLIKVPQEKWIVTEDAHTPIIAEEQFKLVQEYLKERRRTTKTGATHIFAGKLRCPDCKNTINFHLERRKSNENEGYYICRTNRQYGNSGCTRHYIRYSVLMEAVHKDIRWLHSLANSNREHFHKLVLTTQENSLRKLRKELMDEIESNTLKLKSLEKIFVRLYSDFALDIINRKQYSLLLSDLEEEKNKLEDDNARNKAIVDSMILKSDDVNEFINKLNKLQKVEELSSEIIRQLVDYIEIFDKSTQLGVKKQRIRVHYMDIGFINDIEIID